MENKKVTALCLVFMVVAAEANTILNEIKTPRWDQGITTNLNDYVDNTITMLIPFMQQNGLDPMPLPEINEKVSVRPLLVTYSAQVRLHDGNARGLINIGRSGDQRVNYFSKTLRIRLQLQFINLEFVYRYLAKVMNIGPTGRLIANLNRFTAVADVTVDFNKDEIILHQFALQEIGRLSVRLTGNLVSWLLNPIVAMFVRIFNGTIMRAVESTVNSVAQNALRGINADIRNLVTGLEAWN